MFRGVNTSRSRLTVSPEFIVNFQHIHSNNKQNKNHTSRGFLGNVLGLHLFTGALVGHQNRQTHPTRGNAKSGSGTGINPVNQKNTKHWGDKTETADTEVLRQTGAE